jgi:hypothetical protein
MILSGKLRKYYNIYQKKRSELRTDKMSINQAYKSIYKEESIKNNDKHNSNSRLTLKSNIIFASTAATSTTSPTAKLTSHVLEIKEGDRLIRSADHRHIGQSCTH